MKAKTKIKKQPKMYSSEVAGTWIDGISSKTIRKWCKVKEIPHVDLGNRYLVTAKDVFEKCNLDCPNDL
jgi:hypothetical protein